MAWKSNDKTCYDLLQKRYDNKRELLGKMIDNMLAIPKMKYESFELLKALHDTVYESMMSIENLGVSTKNWDSLITNILNGQNPISCV